MAQASIRQKVNQLVMKRCACVCVHVRVRAVSTIFGTMQLVGLGSLRKPVLSASEPQFKHQMNHRHTVATTNSCAASVPHTLKENGVQCRSTECARPFCKDILATKSNSKKEEEEKEDL